MEFKMQKMDPVMGERYVHHYSGSDRYCYKVLALSADGKQAEVVSCRRKCMYPAPSGELILEGKLQTIWYKYGAWRNSSNQKITRKFEFDHQPDPYMDPSF